MVELGDWITAFYADGHAYLYIVVDRVFILGTYECDGCLGAVQLISPD